MTSGAVKAITIRPVKRAPVQRVQEVLAIAGVGLQGDHYPNPNGKRQVTLISAEDMLQVAHDLGMPDLDAALTRRNILVSGINIHQPPGTRMQVGDCLLEITGPCHPCGQMDLQICQGAQAAMQDKGGITAQILEGGYIRVSDTVQLL